MRNILCLWPVTDAHKKQLETAAPDFTFEYIEANLLTKEQVSKAEIILGNIPAKYIPEARNLKWLQLNSAGTDEYVASGILPDSVLLTNATGAYGQAVSEHMFATLLMLQKKLHLYRDSQGTQSWIDYGQVSSLVGKKVLICGLGDIGTAFAKLCKALGAYTLGIRRREGPGAPWVDEVFSSNALDNLLPEVDVVASVLPNTPDTVGIFNEKRFSAMKSTAFFINAGRGNAVDQEALYNALVTYQGTDKGIGGASIDVTSPEPLPQDHPLWKVKNLIITPHVSGFYHLPETFERIVQIATENLKKYENKQLLSNIVDFETGYKK